MADPFSHDRFDEALVQVRADTSAFAADVARMRAELEGPLAQGAARAGRMIEASLARAIRTGSLGFEDLRRVALGVLADIAAQAIRAGLSQLSGGAAGSGQRGGGASASPTGGGGLFDLGLGLAALLLGAPGRAHGGGVVSGRHYLVGERGPELFVPGTTGRIEPLAAQGRARDIRISVTVQGNGGGQADAPRMAQTARQLARTLARALAEEA